MHVLKKEILVCLGNRAGATAASGRALSAGAQNQQETRKGTKLAVAACWLPSQPARRCRLRKLARKSGGIGGMESCVPFWGFGLA